MKKIFLIAFSLFALHTVAQPPARRVAAEAAATRTKSVGKGSVYREFPVAQAMPDDADWRRDIYRSLDLSKDENAVLYYPVTPKNGRENLFLYLFKLILRGQVKAYNYTLDGNEDFSEKNRVSAKELMDRYHFFYEANNGRMRVNDADIPSDQVKLYFIKESSYYDQHTGTFRSKVTALCPVRSAGTDLGSYGQTPLFWVRYDEAAPYLGKLMLMTSNLNNAAEMSADDYFTQALYKGDIYKTENLQDRVLINEYEHNDTALKAARTKIEKQLVDFQNHVYRGDSVVKKPVVEEEAEEVAADSVSAAPKTVTRRRTASRRSTLTRKKAKKSSSRSTGSGTFTVRRERH